jgi:radical SAM superfamily enzyme YgiQ (UPF0313 family)
MLRTPASVVEEIRYWHTAHGTTDFAFYDDALLIDAETHILPLLESIICSGLKVRFHTPNALHVREITRETARLMLRAGFEILRLGLETAFFQGRKALDRKVTEIEFQQAVAHLKAAGFRGDQVGAYLLVGLPGQQESDWVKSIEIVRKNEITPVLAYYTPIPQTALWKKAVDASRFDLENDPIFTNNAILPCHEEAFSWERFTRLKKLARET